MSVRTVDTDRLIEIHMKALLEDLKEQGLTPIGVAGGIVFSAIDEPDGSPVHVFFVMDGHDAPVVYDQSGALKPFDANNFVNDVAKAMRQPHGWRTSPFPNPRTQ